MAILSNGVETIETGSRTWRIICNSNFTILNNLIDVVNNKANKNLDNVENTDFLNKGVDSGLLKNDMSNLSNTQVTEDIVYTDENKGLVLVDRSDTSKKYRLYVDNGNLQIEQI